MIPDFTLPRGSVWLNLAARSIGDLLRKEEEFKLYDFRESADKTSLTAEEKRDIEIILRALHDAPRWHQDIMPSSFNRALTDEWMGDTVVLSAVRKTYLSLFEERHLLPEDEDERDKSVVEELGKTRVLGEYKDGEIVLYINNIKDCAIEESAPGMYGFPYLTVMRYVYLHELMHAFFDRKDNEGYEYNRDQEEGFAEFGTLLLLSQLVKTNPEVSEYIPEVNHAEQEELDWAIRHVESKKGVLQCYSRGAELFKQYGEDKELAKKMLDNYPRSIR